MPKSGGFAESPTNFETSDLSVQATLGADGRLLIPAAVRDAAGIKRGDRVTIRIQDGQIVVESFWSQILRLRKMLAHRIVPGESWADELIADRRVESLRESDE